MHRALIGFICYCYFKICIHVRNRECKVKKVINANMNKKEVTYASAFKKNFSVM